MPKKEEKKVEENIKTEADVSLDTVEVPELDLAVSDNSAVEDESKVAEEELFQDADLSENYIDDKIKTSPLPQGGEPITVKSVQFASFEDSSQAQGEVNKNLDLLMDIKLQMTVELGRTELPIKKVLELTRGSIIELEKIAGEPVELFANGKLVAHGEVVVIEDHFGLRITNITNPEDRLKGIGS